MTVEQLDAVVVGAGFSGIYQLYRLRKQGLRAVVIDQAGDVGGTWYWNTYPGAMSDTESYGYRYSWDRDDILNYPFKEHYVKGPEVLAYLEHVVKKHDLRKDMRFNTTLTAAEWDDSDQNWQLTVSGERRINARYLVTALGLLSKTNFPDIAGIDSFEGEKHHTAAWPKDVDLKGKHVGVIGCGSTGVQVITEIAREVKTLVAFQRHPQYSVPSGDEKVTPGYRKELNDNWDKTHEYINNSITGFGFQESSVSYHSVSPEERERIFQEAWDKGNGFRFMFGTFNDITVDREANEGACEFIRKKIAQTVTDPEKARKLQPHDVYARRPLCDGNASNGQKYFEQFNREHVDIVHLGETPITQIEPKGIRTSDGKLHELDVIIFATGFDAVEGNFTRIAIKGRNGLTLKKAWEKDGPTSYLGVSMPDFPNLFFVLGPKCPFTNQPPAIESEVNFISDIIEEAEKGKELTRLIEATHEAEQEYSRVCEELAAPSLFWKAADNWIFGANIPGKKRSLRFFFGGLGGYNKKLRDVAEAGFAGYKPFGPRAEVN